MNWEVYFSIESADGERKITVPNSTNPVQGTIEDILRGIAEQTSKIAIGGIRIVGVLIHKAKDVATDLPQDTIQSGPEPGGLEDEQALGSDSMGG